MVRTHHTLALITLLSGTPLIALGAQDSPAPSPAAARTAPAGDERTNVEPRAPTPRSAPVTSAPMLPDEAASPELGGQYGLAVAGLVIGTVLIAGAVVGAIYVISRRSWSHSH